MKRIGWIWLAVILLLTAAGCAKDAPPVGQESEPAAARTVEGGLRAYAETGDGAWKCGDIVYRYRLEISGRMPNAAADSTFVYLSNLEEISFERAWKAAGLSSSTEDYFSPEEAILVEMRTDEAPSA